jgi:hypothetical protein
VAQLGVNAHGEILEPGRVTDCYLGLLLPPGPAGEPEAGTVLVVTPAALPRPGVPQPAGSLVYELLTGHTEREPGELVFLADLAVELRAWPKDTWTKLGVDPEQNRALPSAPVLRTAQAAPSLDLLARDGRAPASSATARTRTPDTTRGNPSSGLPLRHPHQACRVRPASWPSKVSLNTRPRPAGRPNTVSQSELDTG